MGEAAGKTMDRQAAAIALAAAHTREYTEEIGMLQRALDRVNQNPDLSRADKAKEQAAAQARIADAQGARAQQVQADQAATDPGTTSAAVGLRDALLDLTRSSRDYAKEINEFASSTLGKINQTLLEELTTRSRTGPRHLWTGVGKEVATNVAGMGIKSLEGLGSGVLEKSGFGKLLGFGKQTPLGETAANAMWVKSADPLQAGLPGFLQGPGSGVGSDVLSSLGKTAAAGGDAGGNGIFSALAGLVIPAFADGVSAFGGGMALVGERGPELVNLPGGSNVTPNHKLGGRRGGEGDIHVHVNAQGASDPAAIEAAARRGGIAGAQHAMAIHAQMQNDKWRRPSGSRH